jgi:hypothetical protein
VTGVRALVDSASLLWRWQLTTSGWDAAVHSAVPAFPGEQPPPPVRPILDSVEEELLVRPQTPFIALHAAVALTAAGDVERLELLARSCAGGDPVMRTVVAPVCDALLAARNDAPLRAAGLLADVLPELVRVGGSAAQREVVEEALLFCLVSGGDTEAATRILEDRLDRRPCPLDARRRASMSRTAAAMATTG